jgi:hypothetical protein
MVGQGGVRPDGVVVPPPFFSAVSGFFQRVEPLLVEAFFPQASVERLDKGMIRRRARATESQFDAAAMCPGLERLRRELRTVVNLEDLGEAMLDGEPLEDSHHLLSRE